MLNNNYERIAEAGYVTKVSYRLLDLAILKVPLSSKPFSAFHCTGEKSRATTVH